MEASHGMGLALVTGLVGFLPRDGLDFSMGGLESCHGIESFLTQDDLVSCHRID